MNAAPLGVFDSGIGGLTVARALFEQMPRESVIYFGDTARVPYGPKSPDTVRRYSAEILAYLLHRGVKAVVIACNTSTAHALPHLQARSSVPVVGVIEPGARAAVAATRTGNIGVIGTAGTVASGAYERAIRALRPTAAVHSQPCPLFVPLVEEGWFDHPATELIAREYLDPLRRAGVDVLVLGCTHYPLLKPLLARVMGGGVTLIDSAAETAKAVTRELAARGLDAPPPPRQLPGASVRRLGRRAAFPKGRREVPGGEVAEGGGRPARLIVHPSVHQSSENDLNSMRSWVRIAYRPRSRNAPGLR